MKRTLVPLTLYSPAGEVRGDTEGNGLVEDELGDGDGVVAAVRFVLCEAP